MQVSGNSTHVMNLGLAARWASILGGVSIISYGMKKGSTAGKVAALMFGGDLVYGGTTGHSPLLNALGLRLGGTRLGRSASIPYQQGIRVDADITLVVVDLSTPVGEQDRRLMAKASLIVGNKSDLPRRAEIAGPVIAVSALTGEGIDALRSAIAPKSDQETGFITSLRHAQLLRESLEFLERAGTAVCEHIPHEMLLLDLYGALRPIDAITGATTADDILNRIFSTFCIGK